MSNEFLIALGAVVILIAPEAVNLVREWVRMVGGDPDGG